MERKPKRPVIGYAIIPEGVQFRCGDCEYEAKGLCHLPLSKMYRREIDEKHGCCDYFDHPGMRIIVK